MKGMTDYPRFFNDIFVRREYDMGIPDVENLTVIDIGAHLGIFSRYIYPKAKIVYSIEASNSNYSHLVENVANFPMIKPYNLAISDTNEPRKLYEHNGDGGYSIFFQTPDVVGEVNCMTLDGFMDSVGLDKVDLVKIDVEGEEAAIFSEKELQRFGQRLTHVVGEIHGSIELKDIFEKMGFEYEEKRPIFKATRRNL